MAIAPTLMRLAIVTTNRAYPWGGAEFLWYDLALLARSRNWPVFAVAGPLTIDSEQIANLRDSGVIIYPLPPQDGVYGGKLAVLHKLIRRISGPKKLPGSSLRKFQPDLILVNECGSFDGCHELWLQGTISACKKPYVTICHNNDQRVPTDSDKKSFRKWSSGAASVFFVSEEIRRMAETQLGTSLHNASLIQNPFPVPKTEFPWPPSPPFRFAVVGRLEIHEKGLDLIISAAKLALGSAPNWELNFYGSGPDKKALQSLIDQEGMSDHIHICGHTSNPLNIWKDHHVCLLGSRWEGFSLVMAEAMACGRPVLRTRNGGASWVEHGRTGWICEPDDPISMLEALKIAWSQRECWADIGSAARHAILLRADSDPVGSLLRQLADIPPN